MNTSKLYAKKTIMNILIFIVILIFSCRSKDSTKINNNEIILVGDIKNLPVKKVYLTDAYKWDTIIDSAVVTNNKFKFPIDSSKYHEPFLASICIVNEGNKREQIFVYNYKRTNAKDTFTNTGFMLSIGKTELYGDYKDRYHRVSLKPNSENDLYFDLKTEHFGSTKNIKFIKETIQRKPSSYFLLQMLYQNKGLYSANELKDILALFDTNLFKSKTSTDLIKYSNYLPTKGDAIPNPKLTNPKGENEFLFNDTAKITMLIFWASWCGPCRLEIPQLKNIRKKFPTQILSMKSISIDEKNNSWQKALDEEKMPWQQFLVPNCDLVKIKAQFTVNAVPAVIFVDNNMKEIKRFVGFTENNTKEYDNFINEYLNKKE